MEEVQGNALNEGLQQLQGVPQEAHLPGAVALDDADSVETDKEVEDDDDEEEEEGNDRMSLTTEERDQALAIKEAVENDPDLESLSDFQYVQLALVDGTNMRSALSRVRHFQWFRREYDVRDTIECAQVRVKDFLELQENMILALSYGQEYGSYAVFIDNKAFDSSACVTEAQWSAFLGGNWYMHQAMNPDFASIRNGIVMCHECEGYSMGKSGGLNTAKRLSMEFSAYYPTRHRVVKFYNTGMFMNITLSTFKRVLPKHLRDKFEIGLTLPNRLDTYYLVPTPKDAQERNLNRFIENLRVRYENEAEFSL